MGINATDWYDIDWYAHGGIRDASTTGDYGAVVRQARRIAGVTQDELAKRTELSQSAVSRLESSGAGDYSMKNLAATADVLGLPRDLVGLAAARSTEGDSPVDRRAFLAAGAAAAATPIAAPSFAAPAPAPGDDTSRAAALRQVTASYRRLDASLASCELTDVVQQHLRLIRSLVHQAPERRRQALASAGSEAASFAGWLAWDMGDYGSARRWYGSSIKAAGTSGDTLLTAYQTGSLASFEADTGAPHQAMRLVMSARSQLGSGAPPLAAAWLASIEAIAHATEGDRAASDRALRACERHAARIEGRVAPWPWIFRFDGQKIAAARVTCAARLSTTRRVRVSESDIATALNSAHDKQRALLHIDVASGHLGAGDVDSAFHIAAHALSEGVRLRSGKIVDRARRLRSTYTAAHRPAEVRAFDTVLHSSSYLQDF
ncbi:helix-turn-helix domain-containing protein [Streptomyces tsukubensis]|uniref:helix-turn-helix domain-containing protein n=1 Tax=Streptomyces tsukubensis TaxID=83656 RepID=UPI001D0424C7|nr:helix-turn-helix transcriptional regulator [Streptomyces tsukubensis]